MLDPQSSPARAPGLAEPLLAFLLATALSSALYWTARVSPLVQQNLHGAIAILFLYVPALAARLSRQPFDYRSAGLRIDPVKLNLRVAGLGLLVTWPFFVGGFFLFYGLVCGSNASAWADTLAQAFRSVCSRWLGLTGGRFRLPDDFALLALSQVVVIAVPEELFFRGYLLSRLESRWPSTRRLWGAPVGKPLLFSSILFGLGHVLVDFDPQRLIVILPGLVFGWMRAKTGSIAAGVLFHALCNLFSDVLHQSFFR